MRVPRTVPNAIAIFIVTTLFACSTVKKIDQIGITDRIVQLRKPAMVYGFDEQLRRDRYVHNLRGMWLAESIANWTGLKTEAKKKGPPFYTDKDWGKIVDFVFRDPWGADDDTDIEYLYLHAMNERQTALLSPEAIAQAWLEGIDAEKYIWVSNLAAIRLLRKGVLPPVTGLGAVNSDDPEEPPNYLMIDAQLTTEFFGALAPGMPERALRLADLPIRTTAGGYAAHAAQFHVLLYSLAPIVKKSMTGREKVLWLSREARKYIPDTSKVADIFDFVLTDFLKRCPAANAGTCGDWEATRDALYERYQKNAGENGFRYYDWYESGINFGTGVMALLYGQGNLKRTIQIGTLSGWDSDNGTATMGGLLGLMNGYDWVVAQFPKAKLSDRYNIYRTRSHSLPDYLPGDPAAEDSFLMMAIRMTPFVEESIKAGGGSIRELNYTVPKLPDRDQLGLSPTERVFRASANNRVRANGGEVAGFANTAAEAGSSVANIADGAEHDFSGREPLAAPGAFVTRGTLVEAGVEYDRPVALKRLRLITGSVGAFREAKAQYLQGNEWVALPGGTAVSAPFSGKPNQIVDWVLPESVETRGIRLQGVTKSGLASIIELDAFSE